MGWEGVAIGGNVRTKQGEGQLVAADGREQKEIAIRLQGIGKFPCCASAGWVLWAMRTYCASAECVKEHGHTEATERIND